MEHYLWQRIERLLNLKTPVFPKIVLEAILAFLPNYGDRRTGGPIEIDGKSEKYISLLISAYSRGCIQHDSILMYLLYLVNNVDNITVFESIPGSDPKKVRGIIRRTITGLLNFFDYLLAHKDKLNQSDKITLENNIKASLGHFEQAITEYLDSEVTQDGIEARPQGTNSVVKNLLSDYPNYPNIFSHMNRAAIVEKTKQRIVKLQENYRANGGNLSETQSTVGFEIYSLIGISGASEFARDPKIMNMLVEIKFFNLNLDARPTTPISNRYILAELTGYFELFQSCLLIESYMKKNTMLSINGLATGFREALSAIVKFRGTLELSTLKSLLRIIDRFMQVYDQETDYHQILHEATIRVYRLEHYLRIKLSSLPNMDMSHMPDLDKIVLLRRGLTVILVRAYSAKDELFNKEEITAVKGRTYVFLNRIILQLTEEETLLMNEDVPENMMDHQLDLALTSHGQNGASSFSSIYRYTIRLIVELCTLKDNTNLYGYAFKLISQKYQVSRLIIGYATSAHKTNLCEYFIQLAVLLATLACRSLSVEYVSAVVSQVCLALSNPTYRGSWARMLKVCNAMYTAMGDTYMTKPASLLTLYNCHIEEYVKMRIDQGVFTSSWSEITSFSMTWLGSWHKTVAKNTEMQPMLFKYAEVTMRFWLFVILDLEELNKRDPTEVKKFSSNYSTLIEPNERVYSNSILSCDFILQGESSKDVGAGIRKTIKKFYEPYDKYFSPLKHNEAMYMLAILVVTTTKIENLKTNRKQLLNEIGTQGSVLRDMMLYLESHLLLDKSFKNFRNQLQDMITALINEYINYLVDLGQDIQTQMELAHRDFIVLCQFCLSSTPPFAAMSRSYLVQYTRLFPPIFYKERVIETLSYSIDRLINKLNLNYSNISEYTNFPFYDQNILTESGKQALNVALNLNLSVLTNMYFQACIMSRYLTKSVTENFIKSTKDYYDHESMGKQYLSYLTMLEPELKDAAHSNPNTNYFLIWLRDPRKFYEKINFEQKRLTDFMKTILKAYLIDGAEINLLEFKTLLSKVQINEKNFLEHFVGALNLSEEFFCKKLQELNTTCMNLELCYLLIKLDSNHENMMPQMTKRTLKKYIDSKIIAAVKDPNIGALKGRLLQISSEKEKQIFEDLSFLLNLTKHRQMTEMDLIDKVTTVCSMYYLPTVFRYYFTEFIPALMRESKTFNYDALLIKIQRSVTKMLVHFQDESQGYDNLYVQDSESNILRLNSKLFSTLYTGKPDRTPEGSMMSSLLQDNYRLSRTAMMVSPSLIHTGIYTIKLESQCIKCIHYIAKFLQMFMPVFFIKVRRIENILVFFELIFKMESNAVRKIDLGTFCEINLSFLQFWSVLEISAINSKHLTEMTKSLRESYFRFNLNYFSWTISSQDCYKEYNEVESLEKIIRYLRDLYFAHSKIVSFSDVESSSMLQQAEQVFIYNQTYQITRRLKFRGVSQANGVGQVGGDNTIELIVSKRRNHFTFKRATHLLGHNSYRGNSSNVYLNIVPKLPDGTIRSSRKLQKVLGDLIADEIEKIKGFFYTKFKHDSRYPDLLGINKVSSQEFQSDIATVFWENPQTALAYALRLLSEVHKPSPILLNKIIGPLVERSVDVFIQYKEFLQYYIDYKTEQNSIVGVEVIMYWEMPFIPSILKYVGEQYANYRILGNFFAKMMLRINSIQLSFYLSQIFQSLDYNTSPIIEDFMIKYSEGSPLFAHQVIWMARVEEKAETSDEIKFNARKREVAARLPMKIIKNMGIEEKKFWDEVDSFYEQITKISSILKPKMPKPEKKEIINKRLELIKMPALVYMPTNPEFRVVKIKLGSGKPMQSAAKCPIQVSFICKKFEGPDKYFSTLKRKQEEISMSVGSGYRDDVDEGIHNDVNEKLLNRSISIKDNHIMRDNLVDKNRDAFKSTELLSKLNNMTEEMFPILTSQRAILTAAMETTNPTSWAQHPTVVGKKAPLLPTHTTLADSPQTKKHHQMTPVDKAPLWGSGFPGMTPNYHHHLITPKAGSTQPSFKFVTQVSAQFTLNPIIQHGINTLSTAIPSYTEPAEQEDEKEVSCIFKTFDDIRRDNLSLQIIRIFQEIFAAEKLDLFLFPYKTISTRTGNEKTIGGVIEVVPNTVSRDQIGKENKYSLHEYFKERYGSELGTLFQEARENFIKSMAAYSVVSYILQIKDRHNGNILIDGLGHLIHIDFGFIFNISPGKNLGFENAQFKLTTEMIDIMGGHKRSEPFRMYVDNTIRAFLAVRKYKELIINLVELITKSTLGCFNADSMMLLRKRFLEDKNDYQAAKEMKQMINKAYKNLRTVLYDKLQFVQNKIES